MNGIQTWVRHPPKSLDYTKTCLLRDSISHPSQQHGFQYLDRFDVVVYRYGDHRFQAVNFQRGDDYARCASSLPTMRVVPVRCDVVWMQRNEVTQKVLQYWREGSDDWGLALLRAIYLARPFLYLLLEHDHEEERIEYGGLTVLATKDENDWTPGVFNGERMLWRGFDNCGKTSEEALKFGKAWVDGQKGEI